MKRYYLKAICIVALAGFFGTHALAQQNELKKLSENDEIIIRKKAGADVKVTVEVKDGEVKINGKPLSEFDDDNLTIRKRSTVREVPRAYTAPTSPFRGGVWNDNSNDNLLRVYEGNVNRPLLGILSDKNDNGAKITSVTKGSAAEKAGLKEGDIITKVDEMPVTGPEDLTRAIGKFKPEDKATITFKRGKKEQKATVTLGKRAGSTTIYAPNPPNRLFNDDDFKPVIPNMEGFNYNFRSNSPRLGIKAQDTEDGKGVKVLEVNDESNAEKAGIKEGDVLLEFDGKTVNSAGELADAAKDAKDKNNIKVKLNRDGKSQEVEIKVPKKLKTASL